MSNVFLCDSKSSHDSAALLVRSVLLDWLTGSQFDKPLPGQSFSPNTSSRGASSSLSFQSRAQGDGGDGEGEDGSSLAMDDSDNLSWSSTADNYILFLVDCDPRDLYPEDDEDDDTSSAKERHLSDHLALVVGS